MSAALQTSVTSNGLSAMDEAEVISVLQSSLYPSAAIPSIKMVLGYCRAAGLDPMQKPVHIVPMWDSKSGSMRDVVMPGIGLYRTQAARSGEYAGVTEPEFGPDVTEEIGGTLITFPAWCKVAVKRRLPSGEIVEFIANERWKENYAVKGGKEKSIAPNAMWYRRPYGQIAKCAEAQALRKAFPEFGSQPTADEMEGRELEPQERVINERATPAAPVDYPDADFRAGLPNWLKNIAAGKKTVATAIEWVNQRGKGKLTSAQEAEIAAAAQAQAAPKDASGEMSDEKINAARQREIAEAGQ